MSADWMPKKREEQLILARTWLGVLAGHGAEWTEWDVSQAEIAKLAALADDAEKAHKQAVKGGDKAHAAGEAFHALVEFMRIMRRRRFVVDEEVDYTVVPRESHEITVEFWQKGAAHRAKPRGYDGAVIVWDVRGTAPEHPQDLVHHALASHTPHTLQFEENERGKTVVMALAWHNRRGVLGRWSEYKTAVVP